jgi:hypothetical protein
VKRHDTAIEVEFDDVVAEEAVPDRAVVREALEGVAGEHDGALVPQRDAPDPTVIAVAAKPGRLHPCSFRLPLLIACIFAETPGMSPSRSPG